MVRGTHVIGIDLGGTNMQIGVVGPSLRVLGRAKKKTRAIEGSQRVLDRLVDGVHEACVDAKISLKEISAVGIGAPGAIDTKRGVVLDATNLRWTNFPLAAVLSRRLGHHIVVDNDVNAAIYGEYRLGAAKGFNNVLGVWIGTGIGGGFILNGAMYYGDTNTAGEIGHTILFPSAPPGSRTLENNCSRTAIVDRLVRLIRSNNPSQIVDLADGDLTDIKARVVAQAYAKNDRLTRTVVDNAAELIGISVANVVTILGIQRVVIGGGLTEAMKESLVGKIRESARKHAFPEICRQVEVVATKLEADAGLLGAAMMAHDWLTGTRKLPATRGGGLRSPAKRLSNVKAKSPAARSGKSTVPPKGGTASDAKASPKGGASSRSKAERSANAAKPAKPAKPAAVITLAKAAKAAKAAK